jgi:hypothetical protein
VSTIVKKVQTKKQKKKSANSLSIRSTVKKRVNIFSFVCQKLPFGSFMKKTYYNIARSLELDKSQNTKVDFQKIKDSSDQNFEPIESTYLKSFSRNNNLFVSFGFFACAFIFICVVLLSSSMNFKSREPYVLGVSTTSNKEITEEGFILDQSIDASSNYFSEISENPHADFDSDGLTNSEEFKLFSNPKLFSTCGDSRGDAEKLIQMIDPANCQPIDFEGGNGLEKYKDIVDFDNLKKNYYSSFSLGKEISEQNDSLSLIGFNASSLEELNNLKISKEDIDIQISRLQEQKNQLDKIAKIDLYIQNNRSFEPYDREYPTPVNGLVYLEVSKKYSVPLKYVLAVAQRESRFGTDRYNKIGNLTRPGQYKNIYSMGLDDSGNNIGFETWEAGVESFGRWYRRFDDSGISDCNKWRIYNPNGDYCKNIEETANNIEYFLKN